MIPTANLRRNIKVIGPAVDDDSKNESKRPKDSSTNTKALILGNKKYCPYDNSLLVYKPNTDTSLCTICGFVDGQEEGEGGGVGVDQKLRPTILKNLQGSGADNISMDIMPMAQQKRRDEYEEADVDTKALMDKGYTILDSQTTVNEQGTYNVEEALRDRERFERLNRNRPFGL